MRKMIVLAALWAGTAGAITPDDVARELHLAPSPKPNALCEALKARYSASQMGAYMADLPLFLMRDAGFAPVTAEALINDGLFASYRKQEWTASEATSFALFRVSPEKADPANPAIWFYLDGADRYTTTVCVRILAGS